MHSYFNPKCARSILVISLVTLPLISHAKMSSDESSGESPDRNFTGFEAPNEAQPLWEFGAGGGVVEVANYPSSSERNFIAFAAPYLIYRGDVFRVGGGSARAVIVEKSDFEVDLSFGGAFAADSDDNTARQGMPELDFLFEVGPQVTYKVKNFSFDNGGDARLNARLQTRAVFSTDFGRIDHRGYVIVPTLSYQQRGVLFKEAGFSMSLSATYASEKLHDYFYQVNADLATDARGEFDAKGGYLGSEVSFGFSFPVTKNSRGFLGGSAQFHQGAANDESPLYEDDVTFSFGAGFVWRLYESDTKASW